MAESLETYSDLEDDNIDPLTETFNHAADHVKKLVPTLQPDKLLEIYSYYKQANEGPCNIPKPRFYEMQAKAKWDAWNKLGNLSTEDAKKQYINIISELDTEFNQKMKIKGDTWVTVSTLLNTDDALKESDKTIFDYVKEGDLSKLKITIKNKPNYLEAQDENGLGLIHWAADRGNLEILKFLIDSKIDVNMTDSEGQTALHYAASCDHISCVDFLITSKANVNHPDSDGMKPADLASDEQVIKLLLNAS